jgi:polyribonucleotide nucleotidyltransferase
MVAVSAALTISGVPFLGPIGAARVGFADGEYILNPTLEEMKDSNLDLVVAGTGDAVLMVESQAGELSEEVMLGAVMHGHREFQPVINAIISLAEKCAKEPRDVPENNDDELKEKVSGIARGDLEAAYQEADKSSRQEKIAAAKDKVMADLLPADADADTAITLSGAFKGLESDIVRGGILDTEKRIDGRGLADVRPIVSEVGILPRAHGSALFTRGETQALVVATLGTGDDEQLVDALEGTYKENFMLHYNFPPYSVGETAALALRVVVKSVTVSWHGGLSSRCCQLLKIFHTHYVSSPRLPNPTARLPWRLFVVHLSP